MYPTYKWAYIRLICLCINRLSKSSSEVVEGYIIKDYYTANEELIKMKTGECIHQRDLLAAKNYIFYIQLTIINYIVTLSQFLSYKTNL